MYRERGVLGLTRAVAFRRIADHTLSVCVYIYMCLYIYIYIYIYTYIYRERRASRHAWRLFVFIVVAQLSVVKTLPLLFAASPITHPPCASTSISMYIYIYIYTYIYIERERERRPG